MDQIFDFLFSQYSLYSYSFIYLELFAVVMNITSVVYAKKNNMQEEIAIAIKEQYSPLGPSDKCPSIPESSLLSFSDKIDSLVGFFLINENN